MIFGRAWIFALTSNELQQPCQPDTDLRSMLIPRHSHWPRDGLKIRWFYRPQGRNAWIQLFAQSLVTALLFRVPVVKKIYKIYSICSQNSRNTSLPQGKQISFAQRSRKNIEFPTFLHANSFYNKLYIYWIECLLRNERNSTIINYQFPTGIAKAYRDGKWLIDNRIVFNVKNAM